MEMMMTCLLVGEKSWPLWGIKKQEAVPLERKSAIGETLHQRDKTGSPTFFRVLRVQYGKSCLPDGKERHFKGKTKQKEGWQRGKGGGQTLYSPPPIYSLHCMGDWEAERSIDRYRMVMVVVWYIMGCPPQGISHSTPTWILHEEVTDPLLRAVYPENVCIADKNRKSNPSLQFSIDCPSPPPPISSNASLWPWSE